MSEFKSSAGHCALIRARVESKGEIPGGISTESFIILQEYYIVLDKRIKMLVHSIQRGFLNNS